MIIRVFIFFRHEAFTKFFVFVVFGYFAFELMDFVLEIRVSRFDFLVLVESVCCLGIDRFIKF